MVAWKSLVLNEPCSSYWNDSFSSSVLLGWVCLSENYHSCSILWAMPVHCVQPMVDLQEYIMLTPPVQVCSVLVLTKPREELEGFCDIKFHTGLVLIWGSWTLRQDKRFQSLWNAGGIKASVHSPRSLVSLCGLAHIVCSFLSYLHSKICATCTSWVSTCINRFVQRDRTAFELLMRSGGLCKQSWQSSHIFLDSVIHNRFCFLSQKLFVQIWLCVCEWLRHKQLLPFMQD